MQNALDPDQEVTWTAAGTVERGEASERLLKPFPGMESPLPLPNAWPAHRVERILFNRLLTWTATSKIRVPKGTRIAPVAPIERRSGFGKVTWQAVPALDGSGVDVSFKVELTRLEAKPEDDQSLQEFIDTVKKAYHQTLMLEQP